MLTLYIMRGLPGSGKSTEARRLTEETGVICSADDYFQRPSGYAFDPRFLNEAHRTCRERAYLAMSNGRNPVVIDNTHSRRWEFQPYLDLAQRFGYVVEIVTVGNLQDIDIYVARCKHNVPRTVVENMVERWEP